MLTEVPIETPTPAASAPPVAVPPLQAGPYSLDVKNCTVRIGDAAPAYLTQFEMTLLVHLAAQPGKLISKEELVRLMYDGRCRPISNGLEVFVGRIRRKIDPHKTQKPIQTVRYSGYRFRNDWQVAA